MIQVTDAIDQARCEEFRSALAALDASDDAPEKEWK